MTRKPKKRCSLGQFEKLLDACGPEPDDWPREARAGALALLRRDTAAKRLHAEALALAALLESAAPGRAPPALVARILKAAGKTARDGHAGFDRVVALHEAVDGAHRGRLRANLPHAALLAASLMLGVWAGATGFADQLVTAPLEFAGLAPSETLSERVLRFDGDLGDLEEAL